jgi:hypothetical protein
MISRNLNTKIGDIGTAPARRRFALCLWIVVSINILYIVTLIRNEVRRKWFQVVLSSTMVTTSGCCKRTSNCNYIEETEQTRLSPGNIWDVTQFVICSVYRTNEPLKPSSQKECEIPENPRRDGCHGHMCLYQRHHTATSRQQYSCQEQRETWHLQIF